MGFKLCGRLYNEALGLRKNGKYRVKDVCEMLEISVKTYRTWERRGWFPPARRDPQSGFRVFGETELIELRRRFRRKARRFKGADSTDRREGLTQSEA